MVWDGENRLIQAQVNGGATVNFTYDAQSRRIAETVGTTTKLTVYDGWNPIAEYGRAGLQPASLAKSFTWGIDLSGTLQGAGGVGGLLMTSLITNNSITSNYFPTYDGNGNVSEYLNESGEVSAHYEYDPFGKTTVATGPKANDFAHRFSTKPLDATTGLYYYGYRYYDPNTGRWPTRDPIQELGGVNLYGFCFNNSFGWYDYLGWNPHPIDFDAWREGARKSSNDANRRNNRGDPEGYDTNEEPKAQDSTPGNKRGDCCGGKWGAKEFIDSAGGKCCDFQVSTIEIRSRYSDARTRNTGHTWIMIDGGAPGLYPNGRPIGSHSDWNAWHWNPANRDGSSAKSVGEFRLG